MGSTEHKWFRAKVSINSAYDSITVLAKGMNMQWSKLIVSWRFFWELETEKYDHKVSITTNGLQVAWIQYQNELFLNKPSTRQQAIFGVEVANRASCLTHLCTLSRMDPYGKKNCVEISRALDRNLPCAQVRNNIRVKTMILRTESLQFFRWKLSLHTWWNKRSWTEAQRFVQN